MKIPLYWALSLFFIILPLSVDDHLSIDLGPYSIRLTYLGAFLWLMGELYDAIRSKQSSVFRDLALRSENRAFFLMVASPIAVFLTGAITPTRTLFFTVWSIGTLILVPWLARRAIERLSSATLTATALYFCIQSLVILFDSIVCGISPKLTIGRIMIYNHMGNGLQICRASAFYQEPGYFAATAAIVALYLQRSLVDASSITKPTARLRQAMLILIVAALFICLSRLGWILGGFILLLELARIFRQKVETPALRLPRISVIISVIFTLMVVAFFSLKSSAIRSYLAQPVPENDASIATRTQSIRYAIQIFKENPYFGVGPGAAGAYNALRWPEHYKDTDLTRAGSRPVAMSLYPELLSEWGLWGTLLFFIGLGLFFAKISPAFRWPLLATILIIYTSTQTLARFDLWFLLGLGMTIGPARPRESQRD